MTQRRILGAAALAVLLFTVPSRADEPLQMKPTEFEKLHSMIKPQPGEPTPPVETPLSRQDNRAQRSGHTPQGI